jgi:hypothetical protein
MIGNLGSSRPRLNVSSINADDRCYRKRVPRGRDLRPALPAEASRLNPDGPHGTEYYSFNQTNVLLRDMLLIDRSGNYAMPVKVEFVIGFRLGTRACTMLDHQAKAAASVNERRSPSQTARNHRDDPPGAHTACGIGRNPAICCTISDEALRACASDLLTGKIKLASDAARLKIKATI